MRQTVVGVFDGYAKAQHAAQQLRDSGFGDSVFVTDESTGAAAPGTVGAADVRRGDNAPDEGVMAHVRHFFADLFGSDDEAAARPYADVLHRGGAVVKVEVDEDDRADQARAALEAAGAIGIEDGGARVASSHGVGQPGFGELTNRDDMTGTNLGATTTGVRVFPRDLDAPPLGSDTIAASTTASTASTAAMAWTTGSTSMDNDNDFRRHFASTPGAAAGDRYEDHEPGYRYGMQMRGDAQYAGRGWDDAESDLRRGWEIAHPGGSWERFKASILTGWDRKAD